MSKYTRTIADIIATYRTRVLRKANHHRPAALYGEVPIGVCPTYATSGQAVFLSCVYRRRGYTLRLDPSDLAKLDNRTLQPSTRTLLEDHWLRGTPWVPILIQVRWLAGRFIIEDNKHYAIALFLAEKGVPLVTVQLLDEGDPPAEECKAAALFAHGLERYNEEIAAVHSAEVTL